MYKKLSEDCETELFTNFNLTELMLLKHKTKINKIPKNPTIHLLLNDKLEQYGMQLFGKFEREELTFKGLRLLEGFPVENEPILKQLYGYKNLIVPIQLKGFDDFALAFDYNLDTGECELQKHSWGTIINRKKYSTISEMLNDIEEREYRYVF